MLTYLVPVLFTFYIQGVPKLKKNSGAKELMLEVVSVGVSLFINSLFSCETSPLCFNSNILYNVKCIVDHNFQF